jgi:hypothetical protein
MEITSTASAKRTHPSTLIVSPCMNYEFDTGHKATKWADGVIFFNKKDGTALNKKTGEMLVAQMLKLITNN